MTKVTKIVATTLISIITAVSFIGCSSSKTVKEDNSSKGEIGN